MSTEFLPILVENAIEENEELVAGLLLPATTQDDALRFCTNFRIAGTGALFLTATSAGLHRRLSQSAQAYAAWLAAAPREAVQSLAMPFFDGLATDDQEAARAIARGSSHAHSPRDEYEEDFLFVEFVMQRFVLECAASVAEQLLARWRTCLRGVEDFRLDACKALHEADAERFDSGLRAFLQERSDTLEERIAGGSVPLELASTEGFLSVEGLALLKIADRLRLQTEEEYLHVPSIARERPSAPPVPGAWKEIRG